MIKLTLLQLVLLKLQLIHVASNNRWWKMDGETIAQSTKAWRTTLTIPKMATFKFKGHAAVLVWWSKQKYEIQRLGLLVDLIWPHRSWNVALKSRLLLAAAICKCMWYFLNRGTNDRKGQRNKRINEWIFYDWRVLDGSPEWRWSSVTLPR